MLTGTQLEELAMLAAEYSTVAQEERKLAETKAKLRNNIVSIMTAAEQQDATVPGYHVMLSEREDSRVPVAVAIEKLPYDLLKQVLQTKMVQVLNVKQVSPTSSLPYPLLALDR